MSIYIYIYIYVHRDELVELRDDVPDAGVAEDGQAIQVREHGAPLPAYYFRWFMLLSLCCCYWFIVIVDCCCLFMIVLLFSPERLKISEKCMGAKENAATLRKAKENKPH